MANDLSLQSTSTLPVSQEQHDHASNPRAVGIVSKADTINDRTADSNSSSRRRRWENSPGIRVTLDSLNRDEQVFAYQTLNYEGRRTIQQPDQARQEARLATTITMNSEGSQRQVNRLALEHLIKQMSGEVSNHQAGQVLNERV